MSAPRRRNNEVIAIALRESREDTSVFSLVYRMLAIETTRFIMKRTYDADVTAELTAETFARAFEKRSQFRGHTDDEARGWILTIARRLLADYWRRGSVEMKAVERLAIQVPQVSDDDREKIEALVDFTATRQRLARALEDVPESSRAALKLRVIDELSYSEVAESLRVTEETARVRVSRALRSLRTVLGEAG